MVTRNPCLKCLIQACCTMSCEDNNKFNKFSNSTIPKFCIIFSVISVLSFLIFISIAYKKIALIIICMVWFISFLISKSFFDTFDEDLEFPDIVTMFILAPFLAISLTIIMLFEVYSKVDKSILS